MFQFFRSITFFFFLIYSVNAFSTSCEDRIIHIPGYAQLVSENAKINEKTVRDFALIQSSQNCYLEVWPTSTEAVSRLVKIAYQSNISIRTQGSAHSQNGSSLPNELELLIHTQHLNFVRFTHKNTLIAGAGIPLFSLQQFLLVHHYGSLPVVNGGGMGPTIGGYISAGGISPTSELYGGFWENVRQITLVTDSGKILHINSDSNLFPWVFGSMGQLGIITEVTLDLMSSSNTYPLGLAATISVDSSEDYRLPIYWFNLFVNSHQKNDAIFDINQLKEKYQNFFVYPNAYIWKIKFKKFMPPLLYSENNDFDVVGFFGYPKQSNIDVKTLMSLENDFSNLVQQKHYRRYIQAELSRGPLVYQKYFGNNLYQQFGKIKIQLDPKFLFNKNSVFLTTEQS